MDTMEGLLGEATSLANPIIDKNRIGSEGIVQVWSHENFHPFSFLPAAKRHGQRVGKMSK